MPTEIVDTPAEADVRFLGYRLEVVSHWPASPRKSAAAEAIAQRLTTIGRSARMRPDMAHLLDMSCQLLDDFFAAGESVHLYGATTESSENISKSSALKV